MATILNTAFVLAAADQLPETALSWSALRSAQSHGIAEGEWFRMYAVPAGRPEGLAPLIRSGAARGDGADPFQPRPDGGGTICDALIPRIASEALWLGVYQLSGSPPAARTDGPNATGGVEVVRCLDRLPLSAIENETCWFYPTDDGTYLSWRSQRRLRLEPGHLPDPSVDGSSGAYSRDQLRLLWSLMADDTHLTCVGLTYGRRRIDWPVREVDDIATSTWTLFAVDSMASAAFRVIESHPPEG